MHTKQRGSHSRKDTIRIKRGDLRMYLQSIAILAVQAQNDAQFAPQVDGSLDAMADQLDSIASDLQHAQRIVNQLQRWSEDGK